MVVLIGRIYLGMHSVVDIIAGLVLGLVILASWIVVHDYVDSFVVSGLNGMCYWLVLTIYSVAFYFLLIV